MQGKCGRDTETTFDIVFMVGYQKYGQKSNRGGRFWGLHKQGTALPAHLGSWKLLIYDVPFSVNLYKVERSWSLFLWAGDIYTLITALLLSHLLLNFHQLPMTGPLKVPLSQQKLRRILPHVPELLKKVELLADWFRYRFNAKAANLNTLFAS